MAAIAGRDRRANLQASGRFPGNFCPPAGAGWSILRESRDLPAAEPLARTLLGQGSARHRARTEETMDLLVTLIIGGVVGWLASIVMRTNAQMGLLANVVVGVIGSFLGVALARTLGVSVVRPVETWIVSILGAVLLIAILRALGAFRGSRRRAWR
jgi:uncharacterized membrane protein YeaQ/YmgE (transglycosylase-associated protein family)